MSSGMIFQSSGSGICFGTKFTGKFFQMGLGMYHQIIFDGKTCWANITDVGFGVGMHPFDMLLQIILAREGFVAELTIHVF